MKNFLCLHGHFYQPPRENPWTGTIPVQESAKPFANWNIRIAKECYGANANSRILSPQGRITDLVNNYQYISFNVGPTLLDWLKAYAPRVYSRILEADRISLSRYNGHGNALAQGYNHTILPLAAAEDKKTQIIWGLKHFEYHFKRKAEGFWLPETALDPNTAEILVEQGVKFVILSPWQAQAIKREGEDFYQDLGDSPAPSGRPCLLETPAGELTVFFYNPVLAQRISFDHLLKSADLLYNTLLSYFKASDTTNLITVATDGEVYGHHEPFGDMCLAALIRKVEKGKTLEFINYGGYLELFPPKNRVKLRGGEEDRGTSWSCSHGVSRWYKDCGCSTGGEPGWNQKWRVPLRKAMDDLQKSLTEAYHREFSSLSDKEPGEARNRYIKVLTGEKNPREFADSLLKENYVHREEARQKLLTLLEGQRFGQFMFTSCGWFFADLCGLEATQNIQYALKALELYKPFLSSQTEEHFLSEMEKAVCNEDPSWNGRRIADSRIIPGIIRPETAAAELILRRFFSLPHDPWFIYQLRNLKMNGNFYDKTGNALIIHKATGKEYHFSFKIKRTSRFALILHLQDEEGKEKIVNPASLSLSLRSELLKVLFEKTEEEAADGLGELYQDIENLISSFKNLHTRVPESLSGLGSFVISAKIKRNLAASPFQGEKALPELKHLLTFAETHGIILEKETLSRLFADHYERKLEPIRSSLDTRAIEELIELYNLEKAKGLTSDITIFQNALFRFIQETGKRLLAGQADDSAEEYPALKELYKNYPPELAKLEGIKRLYKLGDAFGIDVEGLKESLLQL